jgi:phage protein D
VPSNASLKYRRGTTFDLKFPTLPSFQAKPQRVNLYQESGKHDILIASFVKSSSQWFKHLKTGTPVVFTWTQDRVKKSWTGYVTQVVKTEVSQRDTPLEVTCMGASFVLKQKSREVFKNKTIPEIAKIIANKHKLHFSGVQHSRRYAHISLNGQSYWHWLQEYAKKIGYVAYIENATLVFKPFDAVLNSSYKNPAVFLKTSSALPINNQAMDRTLDSLTVYNGDYNEGLEANRTIKVSGGIDPVTGKILGATANPKNVGTNLRVSTKGTIFTEFDVHQVVNDFTAVTSAATGAAHMARFTLPAKAVGQGDPRVQPYHPVMIFGTGELSDGAWLVLKAHHMFHRVGDYQIEMALATDGLGPTASVGFRDQQADLAGIINIDELLLASETNTVSSIQTVLDIKEANFYEGNQGFVTNKTVWRAKRYSGQGCCS